MRNYNELIEAELKRAKIKHPEWPNGVLSQTAIMVGEAGEALKAALKYTEQRGQFEDIRAEVIQTAAMCLRRLENNE